MKVPAELISQWLDEGPTIDCAEYIAQRAAEWALSQPVSMEPVAWMVANDDGEDELWWHDGNGKGRPLYTAAQLAQARQQGAEEERDRLSKIAGKPFETSDYLGNVAYCYTKDQLLAAIAAAEVKP